jgi:hypothetical protein
MKLSRKISLGGVGILVGMLVVMFWYPVKAARLVAKSRACEQNIKQLRTAISAYLKEHKTYPPKLSALYPQYVSDLNVFVCPGNPIRIDSPEEIDSRSGYALLLPGVAPIREDDIIVDDRPLLCDRRLNHLGKTGELWGGHILYCDEHFQWKMDRRAVGEWENSFRFDFPE